MANRGEDKQRGVRLADIRVPRYWPVSVIGALLLARRQRNSEVQDAAETGQDLGEATVTRWKETDARADQLTALTNTLARLTWVLLAATVATLVVNVVILVSG
jgi:hypothetical protein